MRHILLTAVMVGSFSCVSAPAWSSNDCSDVQGDVVLEARTPQVDLFNDAAGTQKASTLEKAKFPACAPIVGRAPNMMLQVQIDGKNYWVAPHTVRYRFAGKLPAVCRNLALGANQEKAGATRGLGEGCAQPGGSH
jgi:hypothetical protein